LLPEAGDKLLLRLNTCRKPIANKYCEGNMKRALKEVKRPETVERGHVEVNMRLPPVTLHELPRERAL